MLITFITDPVSTLDPTKDGTLSLAREAIKRHHEIVLVEGNDLKYQNNKLQAAHYTFPELKKQEASFDLRKSDVIMMRVDPPLNLNYIYCTQLLDRLQKTNPDIKILNPPHLLQSWNEKLSILNFPDLIPETIITKKTEEILSFANKFEDGIILKPLNEKGGNGIEWLKPNDTQEQKLKKITHTTKDETEFIMAQRYLSEARIGDKRITIANGKIINCILRVPHEDDFRGNICQGATAHPSEPTEKELKAVKIITKELTRKSVFLTGLDFIGEHLTEINITSPITGHNIIPDSSGKIIQELERFIEEN
jgi:glutathione synthase